MDRVVKGVKELRQYLGDSQQAFANRLGLSIRAIANYEKDRRATGMALISLARAASDAGKEDLMNTFMEALMNELGLIGIPFRFFSGIRRDGRLHAYLLAHLDDKESIDYVSAFWIALQNLKSGVPEIEDRAREHLQEFKAGVDSDVPRWASLRKREKQ